MWRLVLDQRATLREIEEWWSIDDVFDAAAALDAWQEASAPPTRG